MRLSSELASYGCDENEHEFRSRILKTLAAKHPGRTIADVLCRPDEAIVFCDAVRAELGGVRLPDAVPLKALLNLRKGSNCPTGLKTTGTRMTLKSRLKNAGCEMSPDLFRDLLVNALVDMYKDQTVDNLLCNPVQSAGLCKFVRRKSGCMQLTDEMILKSLVNVRKAQ